jgi:hypothetical protein
MISHIAMSGNWRPRIPFFYRKSADFSEISPSYNFHVWNFTTSYVHRSLTSCLKMPQLSAIEGLWSSVCHANWSTTYSKTCHGKYSTDDQFALMIENSFGMHSHTILCDKMMPRPNIKEGFQNVFLFYLKRFFVCNLREFQTSFALRVRTGVAL